MSYVEAEGITSTFGGPSLLRLQCLAFSAIPLPNMEAAECELFMLRKQ